MFYVEEDLTPAVNHAINLFGRNGARRFGKDIEAGVSVATREFGKIWYGDADKNTLEVACTALSERLNQRVYLFYQDTEFNFESARVFFKED
jgi:hypothetical protein